MGEAATARPRARAISDHRRGDLLMIWGRENPDGKPEPPAVAALRREVRSWTRMKLPDDTVCTVPLSVLRQALGEEAR